jgi:formylglycine-generating enzyme required for sulfatase activity
MTLAPEKVTRFRRWLSRNGGLALAFALLDCASHPTGLHNNTSDGGAAQSAATRAFSCTSNAQPADMVAVPAAQFSMGCSPMDTQCRDDEKPQHVVTLQAFQIDRTEVSQDQYTACVEAKACSAPKCDWDCTKATYPAGCLDWSQAKAYCAWAGKRLPTEAEWEMAARGTDGRIYPWGDAPPDCTLANVAACGGQPEPVGMIPAGASPYGALDMAGNVVEMVADWFDVSYYSTSPATDPTGPAAGTKYGGRGGGYKSEPIWQRASSRDWYNTWDATEPLGFRCAR